jgi:hypothetical protein
MTMQDQIANTVAASLSYAYEDDPVPLIIGRARAERAALAVLELLWTVGSPAVQEGRRGRLIMLTRDAGELG